MPQAIKKVEFSQTKVSQTGKSFGGHWIVNPKNFYHVFQAVWDHSYCGMLIFLLKHFDGISHFAERIDKLNS